MEKRNNLYKKVTNRDVAAGKGKTFSFRYMLRLIHKKTFKFNIMQGKTSHLSHSDI